MPRLLLPLLVLAAGFGASAQTTPDLRPLGTYATGRFDEGAAEIVDYDPATNRAFFVNAEAAQVQALDLSNPTAPTLAFSIDLASGSPNSVAVSNGIVAVAVEAETVTDAGEVRFYSTDGAFLRAVTVGALPDALAFSADGRYVVVANEGEPADGVDPEGTVSIIDLGATPDVASATVTSVGFTDFNEGGSRRDELDFSVLLDPASPSVAQDFEPEYVAIYGTTAYVTLQEANAIAVIDITDGTVDGVYGLQFKRFSYSGSAGEAGIDPSDQDGGVNIDTVRVLGAFQPDALAAFEHDGTVYLITANEGDARDSDDARVADLTLDPEAFPDAAELQRDENLGRLHVRPSAGDTDGDGDQDRLVAFGGRSFTIYRVSDTGLTAVDESYDEFEQITAERYPDHFNADNDSNDSFDSRSDDKGPEPEAVTVAMIDGRRYAFIGLERIGGVMVYDITTPGASTYVTYFNNRDFSVDVQLSDGSPNPAAGDLGPESIRFVSAEESATGDPFLLVANEVSGTVTAFALFPESVPTEPGAPGAFALTGVFPNPAGREASVGLVLPAAAEVQARVFDLLGREVAAARAVLDAGPQALPLDVSRLAAGAYVVRVTTTAGGTSQVASGRLTVVR